LSPLLLREPSVHSSGLLTIMTSMLTTDKFSVLRKTVIDKTKTDFETAFVSDTLIYDFNTGETNKVTFVNDDFPLENWFPVAGVQIHKKSVVAGLTQMFSLFNALEAKQLKGELEKLVATLDEEDNPIVTIVKFK